MSLYITLMFFVVLALIQNSRNMGKTEERVMNPASVIVVGVVGVLFYWMHWEYFSLGDVNPTVFYTGMTLLAIYYLLIFLRAATCKVYKVTVTPLSVVINTLWGAAYTLHFFKYVI